MRYIEMTKKNRTKVGFQELVEAQPILRMDMMVERLYSHGIIYKYLKTLVKVFKLGKLLPHKLLRG